MYMDVPTAGTRIDGEFASISQIAAIEAAVVRAVLRGEERVAALKRTSLRLSADRLLHAVGSPLPLFATVRTRDLAQGLLALKDDAAALADWAGFVVVSAELLGFEDRHSAACDRLLAAIWNLAFGAPVDEPTIRLAHSIAKV